MEVNPCVEFITIPKSMNGKNNLSLIRNEFDRAQHHVLNHEIAPRPWRSQHLALSQFGYYLNLSSKLYAVSYTKNEIRGFYYLNEVLIADSITC